MNKPSEQRRKQVLKPAFQFSLSSTRISPIYWLIGTAVLMALTIFVSVTLAQTTTVQLAGGEQADVTCDGRGISIERISRTRLMITCKPSKTPPTTVPQPTNTAVPAPTNTPVPQPTATAQPQPTATTQPQPEPTQPPAGGNSFLETFDGDPANPQPWNPANWDVTVHSRDGNTRYQLESMQAAHGQNCEAPPATHTISSYDDAVYNCKNHVMTAINASGYGVIYLTPNQMVDFSNGEAVVRIDVSTLRTSGRDWWDLWITPYEDNLQLPLPEWMPDLSGEPQRSIQIDMDNFNGNTPFKARISNNFQVTDIDGNWWTGYEEFLTPDPKRRDTYELRISRTHIKFGMPDYNFWWIDTDIPPLDWTQGVVQIGHHSYNPTKDCSGPCSPNTWHWDNLSISPSVPFTILKADQRYVEAKGVTQVNFNGAAPANSHLRFAGIGKNIEVSFDGGTTWQRAEVRELKRYAIEHFWSYWTPVPQGTASVLFRGQKNDYGEDWMARDITIWSPNH